MEISGSIPQWRLWTFVSQIGTQKIDDEGIKKKIVLSNQLSLLTLIGIIASTFVFAYANGYQELTFIIASLAVVPILTLALNWYAHTDVSRLFFGLMTPVMVLGIIVSLKVVGASQAYAFRVNEYHFYTPRYYLVAMCLLPLFLIDLGERKMFAASLLVNVCCLAFFDYAHDLFGVGYQHFGFEFHNYYQASIMPIVLLFFMYGSIVFYQFESKKYENKIMSLMKQLKVHNDQFVAEIALAKKVVERVLPERLPKVEGLKLSAHLQWSHEVGGDYYTVEPIDRHRTLFIVADVSGKGLAASITVSTLHSYVETHLQASQFDLRDFVTRMNEVLCKVTDDGKYITCWIGVYDNRSHTLQSVNAGHPVPLVYNHASKQMRQLGLGGTILGFFDDDYHFEIQHETLLPDDVVLAYTDGITEASNSSGQLYEENNRLLDFMTSHSKFDPSYMLMSLKAEVTRFTGSDRFEDDLTCMVIKKT